jgi:TetR/AcrR family transcriptional regulator
MTARTRDPEGTRAAILDAAEEVFLDHGFGNASVSQIAKHAGVTKSLIHHHFGSKEELWNEIKQRRFEIYASAQMKALEEAEPSAKLLREAMETYFRFLGANQQIVRILAWVFLESEQHDSCMRMDKELVAAGAEKVRQAQEAGELRADIDPRFIIFTMVGLAQHWFQDREHVLSHLGSGLPPKAVDEFYLDNVVKIFFEGVLPR